MTSPCCEKDQRAPAPDEDQAPCCGPGVSTGEASPCCEPAEEQAARADACCGPRAPATPAPYRKAPVEGRVSTLAGEIPRVSTRWTLGDWLGRAMVRLGFRRMSYAIAPGLYAVGRPGANAPVLVSANYKLSFDVLRRAIEGLDAWILVLDTRGVNVWCAAGKGTFGTAELAHRVEATRLAQVVRHRRLVVPQLGAPSVAAHEVQRLTDFGVVFGPVRAGDIPAFLERGNEATAEMRRVSFGLLDRLEVAGLELAEAGRATALLSLLVLAVTAWNGTTFSWSSAWESSAARPPRPVERGARGNRPLRRAAPVAARADVRGEGRRPRRGGGRAPGRARGRSPAGRGPRRPWAGPRAWSRWPSRPTWPRTTPGPRPSPPFRA